MGETEVFPYVGRSTMIRLEGARGPVYPVTTGTFGGVDFLHSMVGEGQSAVNMCSLRIAQADWLQYRTE